MLMAKSFQTWILFFLCEKYFLNENYFEIGIYSFIY